jgi:RecB family endonuclease NucS
MAASAGLPASIPGIGKMERVPLRQVWPHEALDFTTWLEHNTDVLSEALGVSIANVERERAAGSFSVDLVGEDQLGNSVVIENQLERSDHDHLGKLVTYLAAFEAKTAIWIVSDRAPSTSARSHG